jgi:hypothetical protein
MELVFTRPEIGTIVLLSGDSDFSSLVIKLKEYGKYIIGVGIRESSSDLLVQNCDEYYSYNALAGLVKSGEEPADKWDPWELASEAVARMKRNMDVMRADRLKQVMQDIDNSFDEKDLGMSKFSRFVNEAAQRGVLKVSKLENGQMEVDVPDESGESAAAVLPRADEEPRAAPAAPRSAGRRSRGGRGRRSEAEVEAATPPVAAAAAAALAAPSVAAAAPLPVAATVAAPVAAAAAGERLTRSEALDLLRRAMDALAPVGGSAVPAAAVREKARALLGRDSETLSEKFFTRILQDAHDADVVDLRRRGDDFEVARVISTVPIADQLRAPAAAAAGAAGAPQAARPQSRAGRAGFGKKLGEAPPELLAIGVVNLAGKPAIAEQRAAPVDVPAASVEPQVESDEPAVASKKKKRGKRAKAEAAGDAEAKPARKRAPRKAAAGKGAASKAAASKGAAASA